ncbi:hypothetical protein [Spirosoma sp. 48-14]|uniref:hypothetical protein n=1 Tax=Spirosoma sp. 48-14 TaxID=1895854 RepID=UPI000969B3E3|nr:hypothetical protein [Spirosoma sp. 48-14]OJW75711.1 MAG: hypothetical protein BGO59_09100 [Spirosoma sp. 48-14]
MALLTEDQQNVAVRALATTLGKDVSDIETMLTGDKPGDVDTLVGQRIKAVRNEGDKAGRGILQKAANKVAKDLFGLESTPETIEDLLNEVKEKYKPEVDPTKLTEEQVKSHPAFKAVEKALKDKDGEHQKELTKVRNESKAEANLANLTAKAIKALQDNQAVISDDPKIAAVQERMYLEQLQGVEPKLIEGTTDYEYWKDGKRIETDKLFPVGEKDFFKGLVENVYTTKVSDQKSSTGLNPEDGKQKQQGEKKFKGEWPKTQQEYEAIISDRDKYDIDQRQEVITYWKENSKS